MYEPVKLDDSTHAQSGVELSSAAPGGGGLKVIVLLKEKKHQLSMSGASQTIGALKAAIEAATEVPVEKQRLIYGGKQLTEANKTLASYKVVDGASIHLFPKVDLPPPSAASAPALDAGGVANPLHGSGQTPIPVMDTPFHRAAVTSATEVNPVNYRVDPSLPAALQDPLIMENVRIVRFWSIVLVGLSILTIANTTSYFLNTGKWPGVNAFDRLVNVLDFSVSCAGVAVGRMGLSAAASVRAADLKEYSRRLGHVAVVAIVFRVLWVVDIIQQVKADVATSKAEAAAGGGAEGEGDKTPQPPLPDNLVMTIGIQCALIGMICIFVWMSCFVRSVQLHHAVAAFDSREPYDRAGVTRAAPAAALAEEPMQSFV